MSTPYRILVARRASRDFRGILDRIRSRRNRPRVAARILDAIKTLAASPNWPSAAVAAPVTDGRSHSHVRAMTVAWWVVFFRVHDAAREVRVLRVRHRRGRIWFRRWLADVIRRERHSVSERGRINRFLLRIVAEDAARRGPRTDADELCEAAAAGDIAAVRNWLARGVPADVENRFERTPISLAEDVAVIRALLDAGADASEPWLLIGWVDAACDVMHQLGLAEPEPDTMEILRLLLAHGADPKTRGAQGYSALDLARRYACQPIIRFLEVAAAARRG